MVVCVKISINSVDLHVFNGLLCITFGCLVVLLVGFVAQV